MTHAASPATPYTCPVTLGPSMLPVCRHGFLGGHGCPFSGPRPVEELLASLAGMVNASRMQVAQLPESSGHGRRSLLIAALDRLEGEIRYYGKAHRREMALAGKEERP